MRGIRITALALGLSLGMIPFARGGTCPITASHNIVVYGETGTGGVGISSRSWINHFLDWWKAQDPRVHYVIVDATAIHSSCRLGDFPGLKLYIQPGGDAYDQQRTLGPSGKSNILDYLNKHKGAYLGICAGFYYASTDYWWQDHYYRWPHLLGIFPTTEGSIREIADYDVKPGYALTALNNGFQAVYYGGPTRSYERTDSSYSGIAEATFAALAGRNMPAIIKNGKILLTSVHLEAFENEEITGLTTAQRIENYKLLANLINATAGTDFHVPPYQQKGGL